MKLSYSFASAISAIALSATTSFAAPLGSVKGAAPSVGSANSQLDAVADIAQQPGLFTPVTQLPGQIGSIAYASNGQCIAIALGGSATPAVVNDLLDPATRPNIRSYGKDFFLLVMCPTPGAAGNSTTVILANARGARTALSGRARNQAGSIFVTTWDQPNMLASATLANSHIHAGSKFLTEDYEIGFGTDRSAVGYFFLIDKVQNKVAFFSPSVGANTGEWNEAVKDVYARTIGRQALSAPKIIVAN